jgi:hypothetical protein
LKILTEEVPAITWLVGAVGQEGKQITFKKVEKEIALPLLKFHFVTIKRDRGLYTVTIVKRGVQFLSNLMMMMGLNPRPEGKPVDEHIIELAEQFEG